jgi:hypothetical protein
MLELHSLGEGNGADDGSDFPVNAGDDVDNDDDSRLIDENETHVNVNVNDVGLKPTVRNHIRCSSIQHI